MKEKSNKEWIFWTCLGFCWRFRSLGGVFLFGLTSAFLLRLIRIFCGRAHNRRTFGAFVMMIGNSIKILYLGINNQTNSVGDLGVNLKNFGKKILLEAETIQKQLSASSLKIILILKAILPRVSL